MRTDLVYDLPTRIFHWLFAGLFLTGFAIAKLIDSDSSWFDYHSLAGLTLAFLVLLRIVWGFVGTRHARFSGFALKPMDLIQYFKGLFNKDKKLWAGHNPASSWAGLTMMLLALGLAGTGYLMTSGDNKEQFEDLHELFSDGFIIITILHVAGIILHTFRFQEMIGLSMVDGKKANIQKDEIIPSSRPGYGIFLLGLIVAFGLHLNKNYNSQSRSLQFFGTTLTLTGGEGGDGGDGEENGEDED